MPAFLHAEQRSKSDWIFSFFELTYWRKKKEKKNYSTMSCLHKRPKRTKLQEEAFQEQVKKVAQENGKRLGESPPSKRCELVFVPSKVTRAHGLIC